MVRYYEHSVSVLLSCVISRLIRTNYICYSRIRIFVLEGILTCAVGIFAFTVLVKFPDQEVHSPSPLFLKQDEAKAVLERLNEDRGDTHVEPFSIVSFLKPAKEIEIWGFALLFL